jgi:hypothetical protein
MLRLVQFKESTGRGHALVWWRLLLWSGLLLTSATTAHALQLAAEQHGAKSVLVISPPVAGKPRQSTVPLAIAITVEDHPGETAECLTTSDRVSVDAIQVQTAAERDHFLEALGCSSG